MKVLVCNAGSTSLKFRLYEMPQEHALAESRIERVGSRGKAVFSYQNCEAGKGASLKDIDIPDYGTGIELFLKYLTSPELGAVESSSEIERVGFKTVLAKNYLGVHELTEDVLEAMREYLVVAPVHNSAYLAAIDCVKKALPEAMCVGVFETAFHTTIPLERKVYGVPWEWYEKYGVQKFGYHGASHSYVAETVREKTGRGGKVISCHLGGSGSICAIEDGKSVDTSFGFSLQCGLIQSNRVGDTDCYIVPFMLEQGLTVEEIFSDMQKKSGLLGISGVSNDLRDIQEAASHNERAQLALDVFCNGIIHYIGAYYAELGGLDDLAFTGGIGENSVYVRERVCGQLKHMGILMDAGKNEASEKGIRRISTEGSPVRVWVIPANEELGVARKTWRYASALEESD